VIGCLPFRIQKACSVFAAERQLCGTSLFAAPMDSMRFPNHTVPSGVDAHL